MSQAVGQVQMLDPALRAIIAHHLDGLLSDDPMGYLRGLPH